MKKLAIILTLCTFFLLNLRAQSMSCQEVYETVIENYDSKEETTCFGSSALVKAEYYTLQGMGFVVAYLKRNDYDFRGSPYLFCGISSQRWSTFKSEGMYGSWGKAFHAYIREYTCDCY